MQAFDLEDKTFQAGLYHLGEDVAFAFNSLIEGQVGFCFNADCTKAVICFTQFFPLPTSCRPELRPGGWAYSQRPDSSGPETSNYTLLKLQLLLKWPLL